MPGTPSLSSSSPRSSRRGYQWTSWGVVAITLLAPLLGGITALWAQAVLALATGAFLLVAPPKRSLGRLANWAFAIFLLLALTAFLPQNWFGPDPFRNAFHGFGVALPSTHSPQPWMTLESILLLILGLSWSYLLLAHDWGRQRRSIAWVAYAVGVLGLATMLIISFITKERVPFWPHVPEFGFFPNRNQTSNVLGLGGILIYALALQQFQEGRRFWWLWLATLSLICWALILNYSRAGIILFFFGALAVHIYWWSAARDRRRPLIAFGGLIFLLALFIVDGGATLMRFGKETAVLFSLSNNLRLSIYRDTLILLTKSPVLGVGLGNFPPVFSINRHYSVVQAESIHPESDWLWVATEMGWVAPFLLLILIAWWFKKCRPFAPGTFRILRIGAVVCCGAFAVHGLFDVSGHRIGALWPALFLASTASVPEVHFQSSRLLPWIFRAAGLLLICVGGWWFASISGFHTFPTSATLQRLQKRIDEEIVREDFAAVVPIASEALRIAPLTWTLYYQRGTAEAAISHIHKDALRDFGIARYLLPQWPELCLQEGEVWLAVDEPDLAFDAWGEALRRSPEKAPDIYDQMFQFIRNKSALVDRWRELGRTNKRCLLVFLAKASPVELAVELERLFADDPQLQSLTPDELKNLFRIWYEHGDKLALAETLKEHPDWQKVAWRELAKVYSDYQDYRQAYETLAQFVVPPKLPQINRDETIESLALRFRTTSDIENDGLRLAVAQVQRGELDDALELLKMFTTKPRVPRSVFYVESEIFAQKRDWQKAWQAISQYDPGS